MAESIKDRVEDAGHAVAETAKKVGHAVANGASNAAGVVAEKTGFRAKEGTDKGVAGILEHMDVIASCGKKVGVVDHLEGSAIKLTKKDSPDGQHHFIPVGWVDHVDSHVHLTIDHVATQQGWMEDAASCNCG